MSPTLSSRGDFYYTFMLGHNVVLHKSIYIHSKFVDIPKNLNTYFCYKFLSPKITSM